jgi:Tripartite tricarboxylate transporter family receptor
VRDPEWSNENRLALGGDVILIFQPTKPAVNDLPLVANVERLSNETDAALAHPAVKARLATLGADPMVMGPAEFDKLIADETEKWAKVIKFAGIKAE